MKIIENHIIPFKGFACINLFGVLFVRKGSILSQSTLNHESIHTAQMRELWYIPFYLLYVLEWLYRLTQNGNAYQNISFEKEAYGNQNDMYYLSVHRESFAWMKYL